MILKIFVFFIAAFLYGKSYSTIRYEPKYAEADNLFIENKKIYISQTDFKN